MKKEKESNPPTPPFPVEGTKISNPQNNKYIKSPSSSSVNDEARQKTEGLLLMKQPFLFRLPDEMLNDIIDEITPKLILGFGSMNDWDSIQFFEYANILRPFKRLSRRLATMSEEDKVILDGMTDGAFSCRTLASIIINSFLMDTLNFRSEFKNVMDRIRIWADLLVKCKLLTKGYIRSGEEGIPVNRKLFPTNYYYSKHDTSEDIEAEVLRYYRSMAHMLGRIGDKSKAVQKKYESLEELSFDISPQGTQLNELILENELLKKTQRKGMKVRIVREGVEIHNKTGKEGLDREREQRLKLRKKVTLVKQELTQYLVNESNTPKQLPP